MQKDTTQKQLEAYNDVFVDIYNVAVFGGKEILREEDLVPLPTESYTKNMDGGIRQGFRDVRKADKRNGQYHLMIGIENQIGVDYTMPERVMGYEYASYEEQIKEMMAKNKKEKNPAVTKRIHEEQKLAPVITTVINWGEDEWSGPRHLHDMLEFPAEFEAEIRPLVADYAACRSKPEEWERFMETYQSTIVHPEEVLDTLSALAGDNRYQEVKEQLVKPEGKERKGELKMCVVAEKLENRGIQKGIQKGIRGTIEICQEFGIAREQTINKVMEKYFLTREEAEQEMERCWKQKTE